MAEKKKANVQRGRAAKKAVSSPKKNTAKINSKKHFGDSLYDEILMIIFMLISVIVILSLFTSVMGSFGEFINSFFKGLFGAGAVILPIAVIIFCVWALSSRTRDFAYVKIAGIVLIIINTAALFHLITAGGIPKYNGISFFGQIGYFYKDATAVNGGIIGGLTAWALYSALGRGSYLVVIVFLIIGIMLSTGKSLFTGIFAIIDTLRERQNIKDTQIKAKAENIREREEKRARKAQEAEIKRRRKYPEMDYMDSIGFEKPKYKKGCFNITINGDKGLDDSLPALDAVVFEKKEPEVKEEKEEIYDFKKDAEDNWDFGDKMIEVIGPVETEENVSEAKEENKQEEENIPVINIASSDFEVIDEEMSDLEEEAEEKEIQEVKEEKQSIAEAADEETVSHSEINEEDISFEKPSEGMSIDGVYDESGESVTDKKELEKTNKEVSEESKNQEEIKFADDDEEYQKEVYEFPPIDLLGKPAQNKVGENKSEMLANAKKLEDTLRSFGVEAKVIQINKGPTVTRYELTPSQGVKVSKIVNLSDDIALNLAATGIRIEAPIPGKAAVGIEVPNKETQSVYLRTVLESDAFKKASSKLSFALGEDIAGSPVVTDIAKMPHLLIAGATGSGKSVCINTLITSIIYKADPDEVKMILIDPKVVELSVYNGIPHLLIPVVTDPKKAAGSLNWAVREMLNRYQLFAEHNVRDIKGYNEMKREKDETDLMPQIIIVIDELADLMMAAPGDVEDSICRLAQMARAAGMHLIIATQRPSVDVITGVIKANIPSRLAFAVSSGIDSRTILDTVGAEKLLGKGDMLFYPVGMSKPVRLQGAFVTDKEVESIVEFVKKGNKAKYNKSVMESINEVQKNAESGEEADEHLDKAIDLVVEKEKASVSMLQRQFRIGYNRAARLMEDLERRGIVGPEEGSKPRRVLITKEELIEMRKPKNGGQE